MLNAVAASGDGKISARKADANKPGSNQMSCGSKTLM
jgi:hypothetical protein